MKSSLVSGIPSIHNALNNNLFETVFRFSRDWTQKKEIQKAIKQKQRGKVERNDRHQFEIGYF